MFILAFAFVLTILGTSAAAVNETGNTTNTTTLDLTSECSGSDPIITGTVTVNEYGHIRPLEGATIIVNSTTSGKVVGSATTDANGYYSVNFYSTETTFNVIANYVGCTPITQTVTVSNGPNYPTDPNKYGTANFELTPKTATLSTMGNGQTVYIQGQNKNGFAGVINVNVGGTTYIAYCIDLFTPIKMGDTLLVNGPLPGTAGDLPTEVDWGKVSYILNNYNPSSDTEAAAIQCAIWYFTSVHYGAYNASNPVGTYYQYMTAPNDGRIDGATGSTAVRDRAWQIINAAVSMQYPYSITVTPESITVLNGQSVTVTATVRDINGNPLPGVRVYFQRTRGTLSSTSGVTDANGQVSVTLTNIGTTRNAIVTAYVSGNYGNLLYDDQYASVRKQNLVARNVLPLTISDFCIINTAVQADVTLTQTVNGGSSATVNVGDTVTYVVTATNANQNTATGILISDIVPAGLSGVTVTPSAGTTYYNGIWTIPTLNKLASATLTITGTATPAMAGLTTTNTATRTAQNQYNSQPTSVSASVYTKKADVAVTQTVNGGSSATANVGDTITYIITAANSGPDAATNLSINDLLPSGFTDVSYTITGPGSYNLGTGLWNIGTLSSGSTAILTITGKVTAAMAGLTTTNYANRTTQTEYNPSPASTNTTVYTKKADLSLSQTVNGQSTGTINGNVGDSVTFQITATNNGPDTATNINIRDIVPGGLTGVTVTPSIGNYDSNTGIWTITSLANGASATLTINGILGSSLAGQTITNTANVTSQTEYDPTTPTTTSIPVYTKIADVAVTQTVNGGSNATVNVNDTVTYIITAVNNGVDAATNLQITDIIPSGLTDLSYTITGPGTYNLGTGLWNIGTLNSGATTILTITGKVTAAMAGLTTTNYANRTTQTEYNPSPANTNTTVYTKLSDPIITQTVNGQSTGTVNVNVGDDVTFVVNAYCSGPDDATNIQIRDIIPTGLTDVTVTPSVGTYDPNTGIWTIPFLEKYTSATLTIAGKAGTSMAGTNITNRATEIFQTEYNPYPGDSTSIPVYTKMADVSLTQTGSYQSNVVNFIVTATNNGPDTATNIKITDLIPSGLTGVTVTPSIGTYDSNTGVWTIPELLNSAFATLTITGNATPQTTVTNTAEKTSQTEYDPNTPETTTYNIYVPAVDIIVKNYPWYYDPSTGYLDTYYVGNTPVMIADISNNGPDDATGVVVEYIIGNNFEFIDLNTQGNGQATYNANTRTITWNIGNIPRGGFVFMKVFLYTIGSGNKTPAMTTTAKLVSVDQQDTNNTNNESSYGLYAPTSADIQVNQGYTTYTENGKQYVTYTITVKNNGPDNATGIKIKDLLPTGLQYAGNALSTDGGINWTTNSTTYTRSTGIWNIGNINNGSTYILNITAEITGTGTIKNRAYLSSKGQTDWNYDNNEQTTIIARPI